MTHNLNTTYFHTYHMSYDLITTLFPGEVDNYDFTLRHFNPTKELLKSAAEKQIVLIIINATHSIDGYFLEIEIKNTMKTLTSNSK